MTKNIDKGLDVLFAQTMRYCRQTRLADYDTAALPTADLLAVMSYTVDFFEQQMDRLEAAAGRHWPDGPPSADGATGTADGPSTGPLMRHPPTR
ncbi:hypothetical protein [Pseudaestuariivita rosea]|uniref:hypothetical protein n=1 Tax=Pseudaestuariivita rosea TaxID=2763263 RepID=UPI001ABADD40|nr:hypothetical protein [Pseudaestuariivita rosea]